MERRRLLKGSHSYMQEGKRIRLVASDPNNNVGEFWDFDLQVPGVFKDRFSDPIGEPKSRSRRTPAAVVQEIKETEEPREKPEKKPKKDPNPRYYMVHRGGGRYNVHDRESVDPEVPLNERFLRRAEAKEMIGALEAE